MNDKEEKIKSITRNTYLEEFSEEDRNDPDIVKAVLKKSSFSSNVDDIGNKLLENEDFMLYIWEEYDELDCASEKLLSNKDFIKKAMEIGSHAVWYIKGELLLDEDLAYEAAMIDVDYLNYFDNSLMSNKRFVMRIIDIYPFLLRNISDELRNDLDVVIKAISIDDNIDYFKDSGIELRKDKEKVLKLIDIFSDDDLYYIISKIHKSLLDDEELALKAIRKSSSCFELLSERLLGNKEFVLKAVNAGANDLSCVSETLQNDRQVVKAFIEKDGTNLHYASDELKNDMSLVLLAVSNNHRAIYSIDYNLVMKLEKIGFLDVIFDELDKGFKIKYLEHKIELIQNQIEVIKSGKEELTNVDNQQKLIRNSYY